MVKTQPTILVIEDDNWFADSLAKSLQTAMPGVKIKTVADPIVAMALINHYRPGLLIADLHLGGRNFLTLLNELASYPDTLRLPKIILSASGDQLTLADLANYGVTAVLDKKTYDWHNLVKMVKELLNGD